MLKVIGPDPELVELFREAQRQQALLLAALERLTSPQIYVTSPPEEGQ